MRVTWVGLGLAITFVACGGSNKPAHVEISGKTPSEAAAIAAQAVCAHDARCGRVVITCSGGGSAGGNGSAAAPTTTCTGTIQPTSGNDCYADVSPDIAELLTCAAPSAEQVDTLEICFDTLAAEPCVTQAEADERARVAEMGVSPPKMEVPPACDLIANPPATCQSPPPR
jgi:hypothetical protein